MNYVIFDLEWNQPADSTATVTEPVFLEGEIIEIGAVKLNERFVPVDELRLYVLPRYYTRMHRQIASLTGIRDQDLRKKGRPFPEACREFLEWCGEDFLFMTWSMADIPMLIDNMQLHGMDTSVFPQCCDIQRIFSREILRSNTRYSLEAAMELMKERPDTAHDALNDARNTAKICDHLELEKYLPEYISGVFALPPWKSVYPDKKTAYADMAVFTFSCPWCGGSVVCDNRLSMDSIAQMAYGLCPEEDEFLLLLSSRRYHNGGIHIKRVLYEMSDDLWDIYMDKKEALGV